MGDDASNRPPITRPRRYPTCGKLTKRPVMPKVDPAPHVSYKGPWITRVGSQGTQPICLTSMGEPCMRAKYLAPVALLVRRAFPKGDSQKVAFRNKTRRRGFHRPPARAERARRLPGADSTRHSARRRAAPSKGRRPGPGPRQASDVSP